MYNSGFFILTFFISVGVARSNIYYEHGTKFEVNDLSMLDIHRPNIYIVDLRKESNLNKKLIFTCSTGPKALDVNITFAGVKSKYNTVNFVFNFKNFVL